MQWLAAYQIRQVDRQRLLQATFVDTPVYSWKGIKTHCKPLKVCSDGETLWIALIIENKVRKVKVRMFGYEAINGSDTNQLVQALKQYVHSQPLIEVEFFDFDRYGCPLVKLSVKDTCINNELVASGYCKSYYGNVKEKR
jgi:endonuclease YncB( thermonuclease family)